jgi:hypothetical protein
MASDAIIADLMSVQRDKFAPASRPIVPSVQAVRHEPIRDSLWATRKREVRWWRRKARAALLAEVTAAARDEAQRRWRQADADRSQGQAEADTWWQRLKEGDAGTAQQALTAAFSDNAAPVSIGALTARSAQLRVSLPSPDELPDKVSHVTPSGRTSVRAWKKAEFDEAYQQLLGAHLLATIREAWAVAPAFTELTVTGARAPDGPAGYLVMVTVRREEGGWADDAQGLSLLSRSPKPFQVVGRSREIVLHRYDVPKAELPDAAVPGSPDRHADDPSDEDVVSRARRSVEGTAGPSREKVAGSDLIGRHALGTAPPWVGRRGGVAAVAQDMASGRWRDRHYETSTSSMEGRVNWLPVETFVELSSGRS